MPVILLTDNGSVKPEATLKLRQLAAQLGLQSGHTVHPVSLRHANSINTQLLEGKSAQIFNDFMHQQLTLGERDFLLVPLFFSHNKALSSYLPEQVKKLQQQHGDFKLTIADVIYPLPQGDPLLSNIVYQHILETADSHRLALKNIVLVDHGSPDPQVTEVRQQLANSVQKLLPEGVLLEQAVMERREGSEYDFNGDLLQHWLTQKAQSGASSVIVVLMFFLPGKHAGAGGDIIAICQKINSRFPAMKIAISPLIHEHPALLSILKKRLDAMLMKDKN